MDRALAITIVPAGDPAAGALIAELDDELRSRYPGEPVHGIDVAAFERDGGVFALGSLDAEAVACGALRPFARGDEIELKRMFVRPERRGRGYARQMLAFLEAEAVRRGYTRALLETGVLQPEAIALYASAGWTPIAPYGEFAGNALSRCFAKPLARNRTEPARVERPAARSGSTADAVARD